MCPHPFLKRSYQGPVAHPVLCHTSSHDIAISYQLSAISRRLSGGKIAGIDLLTAES
jgi:hypothetical protein